MTPVEIFQKVWDHFIKDDGKPSVLRSGENQFRFFLKSPNGTRCSIGILIPDGLYEDRFETCDFLQVLNLVGVIPNQITREFAMFLQMLQQAHDSAALMEDDLVLFKATMKHNLEQTAKAFNIDYIQGTSSDVEDISNNNGLFPQT